MCSNEIRSPLENALNYKFIDPSLLERALTHSSVKTHTEVSDYERLEFLGDAVFALVVAEILHTRFPEAKEGDLTKLRSALVRKTTLADIARELNLQEHIRVNKGDRDSALNQTPGVLADVVEAIVGAVFLDAGYDAAKSIVTKLIDSRIETVSVQDPKSELQEMLQAKGITQPIYKIESVEGPDDAPKFISLVEVSGTVKGRGVGMSKKESQQAAAKEALDALKLEAEERKVEVVQ